LKLRTELDKRTKQETKSYHENVADRIDKFLYQFQNDEIELGTIQKWLSTIVPIPKKRKGLNKNLNLGD
jgi:hypothetical protein